MKNSKEQIFLCVFFICGCYADLNLVFEKTPEIVQESLTRNLNLRCGVNSSAISDDVRHISSLVITRNGKLLATVTQYDSAKARCDLDNLNVKGNISGNHGEFAYIELQWTYPTESQDGQYVCEANALDNIGHGFSTSKAMAVQVSSPNIKGLIKHVIDLELKNLDFESKIGNLTGAVDTCHKEVDSLNVRLEQKLPSSDPVAFSAGVSSTITVNSGTTIVYDHIITNLGNSYDPKSGHFVCKKHGLYKFDITLMSTSGDDARIVLRHNNTDIIKLLSQNSGGYASNSNNVFIQLSVGDIVKVVATMTSDLLGEDSYNTFSGQHVA